ncbi:MAG: hypothetical protein ACETVR_00925 [Candidatus Bathyarchaeia archaeon]
MSRGEALPALDIEERRLLEKLIEEGLLELRPTIDRDGIRTVEVERVLGKQGYEKVHILIESLAAKGVVESRVMDRLIVCPDCGSLDVYSKYTCPKCHSINVEFTELLEHVKCGYIGPREAFLKDGPLVCPNCKTIFKGEEDKGESGPGSKYLVLGSCYRCEKCGYRFDVPEIIHICQKCQRIFTYRDARYVKVYAYRIPDFVVEEFGRALPIKKNIGDVLKERGYNVKMDAEILGVSKAIHTFDIIAEKSGIRLVIDVSKRGAQWDMVSLLGKRMDINPTAAILIDPLGLGEVESLSTVYGIPVIRGRSEEGMKKVLIETLVKIEEESKRQGER